MLCCLEKLLPLLGLPFSSPPHRPGSPGIPQLTRQCPAGSPRAAAWGSSTSLPAPTPPAHLQPLSDTLSDEKGKRHDLNLTSHPKLCL